MTEYIKKWGREVKKMEELTEKVVQNQDIRTCGIFLLQCGMNKISLSNRSIGLFTSALEESDAMSPDTVTKSFTILRTANSNHRNTQKFVATLQNKVQNIRPGEFNASQLSSLLFNSRKFWKVNKSFTYLVSIKQHVSATVDPFSCKNIANALFGLQGMSSDSAEVCSLLSALCPKVVECRESFSAQHIGNALYGLQGMSSDCVEVRSLLSALCPKVVKCKEPLDAQAIGNALYGLQGMSSDSAEVRSLLSALCPKVVESRERLSAQHIGNALYGLQGMSSDCVEVRSLLIALCPKVIACREPLSAQAIGKSLYGLHGMS